MNEKLKFSFGHIIAFAGLLFIGYVVFMGGVYYSSGDFTTGLILMGAVVVALFILLMLLQREKAASERFEKHIKRERVFLGVLIIACLASFVPYMHFWNVLSRQDKVLEQFSDAVGSSRGMFDTYEQYVESRDTALSAALNASKAKPEHAANVKALLSVQLKPGSYETLKADALEWISSAEKGKSVFNVFLFGNVAQIQGAISSWDNSLHNYAKHTFAEESPLPLPDLTEQTNIKIDELKNTYSTFSWIPSILAILTGLLAFFSLFVPYLIQPRNTKSWVRTFGKRAETVIGDSIISEPQVEAKEKEEKKKNEAHQGGYSGFTMDFTPGKRK